jgi:two-component system CheB/CheR fusion protein
MLFREQIVASQRNVRLQVFASDLDPESIAVARVARYPKTIAAEVSPARLARFFSAEDDGFRILPELRADVLFTVQDVLSDPPFSNLDLVSCRNLLIHLAPEAQAKVISLFHFALRQEGLLLLGAPESVEAGNRCFELIAKPERLYRHIRQPRLGEPGFFGSVARAKRDASQTDQASLKPVLPLPLAEICKRSILERFSPAAVLVNRQLQCLYSLGTTDRYLRIPSGQPTQDLLALSHPDLRSKLRRVIQRALQENTRVVAGGGRLPFGDRVISFSIEVQPLASEQGDLLLICFVDEPASNSGSNGTLAIEDTPRIQDLEQELIATRTELEDAIRSSQLSNEEQNAINEETMSVNEEYQAANEELVTSKEELQSLNEELAALNTQLQETLELQRTSADDLQNILYSTNVATLFLDVNFRIRFFTPSTKSLFNVIPSDIGRPLADLNSLSIDGALVADADSVLHGGKPIEREIEARDGAWYIRRILPYRTQDDDIEGVVITFTDITERRRVAEALQEAEHQAQIANAAKSRFLAAASHDLRQPLQTLALLQGLLAKTVEGERARELVARIDETLGAISGMLNTLLDINQIDVGTVHPELISFEIEGLLERLRGEFTYHADAQKLALHVVGCSLVVRSDPRLLEQMIRNLLSNAFKYTRQGKVLLGCRRRAGTLRIEVWDTGVGIPEAELQAVFEEYHQLDNAARERSRGLGLGLSIVERLGKLLGHPIHVRSRLGVGSVFAIEVELPPNADMTAGKVARPSHEGHDVAGPIRKGRILVVEDDPELRSLLKVILTDDGHQTVVAADGPAAVDSVARGTIHPDIVLADYNLPGGMNGLELALKLRAALHRQIPVIVLSGDISTETLQNIAGHNCIKLSKPVQLKALTLTIQRLLAGSMSQRPSHHPVPSKEPVPTPPRVVIVDDDSQIREGVRSLLEAEGQIVEDYADCESFLAAFRPSGDCCLLVDAYLPGMSGLDLLQHLSDIGQLIPSIVITGNSDVRMAVQAMKAGALDFIEKPIRASELLASIARAREMSRDASKRSSWRETASSRLSGLTTRQQEIMTMVLAGHPSKNIAADLGISQRTVENHRASIMKKTGAKSLPALARLALTANWSGGEETGAS